MIMSKERLRMFQWLLLSLLAYFAAAALAGMHGDTDAGLWPRLQTVLWKVGHLNLAAYLGYWIARSRLGRLTVHSPPTEKMAHAIVLGATMLAFGLAL